MLSAAVLVPVYRSDRGDLRIVLIRRAAGGVHGGQIAFPGGKCDESDRTMLDTALRETEEELGIPRDHVEPLEPLPVVETISTGFRVAPFLARIARPPAWRLSQVEIDEVFEVPVSDLALPAAHGRALQHAPMWPEPREVAFVNVGPHRVWGLTYRILHPLVPRLLADEWPIESAPNIA